MKKYIILSLAAVLALAYGCAQIETENPAAGKLVEKTYVISSLSSDQTRATLSDGLKSVWEVGDEMSVYDPIAKTGRKFTVVSVNSGNALISGSISEGDFKFSAVYPYSAVTSWESLSSCTIDVPMAQTVKSGRNVDAGSLIAGVYSADASAGTIQFNCLYSLLKFGIERDDISAVQIALASETGTVPEYYKVSAEEGTFAKGSYYALVKPGTYNGGISVICTATDGKYYRKVSSNVIELSSAGMLSLSTVSDGSEFKVEGTLKSTVNGVYDYMELPPIKAAISGYEDKIDDFISMYLGNYYENSVDLVNITFPSTDTDGNIIELSARLYYPTKKTAENGFVLTNHTLIASAAECPTSYYDIAGVFAWYDCAVLVPDGLGFGSSAVYPINIVNVEYTAKCDIDAYKAAQTYLSEQGFALSGELHNWGYSGAASPTLANLKYVSEHPELGITFPKTYIGGGLYNFSTTLDTYATSDPNDHLFGEYATFGMAVTIASLNESEKMGLDYAKIFQTPLNTQYEEYLLSKKYSTGDISSAIGYYQFNLIYTSGIVNRTSTEATALKAKMNTYRMDKSFTIPSDCTLRVLHSQEDDYAPYVNYTNLKTALGEQSNITYTSLTKGLHDEAVADFLQDALDNW